jgi:hypothetical protein
MNEIQGGQSRMGLQRLAKDAPIIVADGTTIIQVQIHQTPVVG